MAAVVVNKRKGFQDEDGKTLMAGADKKLKPADDAGKAAQAKAEQLTKEIAAQDLTVQIADADKPFMGAQPKFLQKPEIASEEETRRATAVAKQTITSLISKAKGVVVLLAQDSMHSKAAKSLLDGSLDEAEAIQKATSVVALAADWQNTLPGRTCEVPKASEGERLMIYVGTCGKYATMCIRSDRGQIEKAYKSDRLVTIVKGVCMLPIGSQEENVFGVDENALMESVCAALRQKGQVAWGLGAGTKASYMQKAYGYPGALEMPKTLSFSEFETGGFDCLAEFVKYTNDLKLAKPEATIKNYYDTGLTVSVLMGTVVQKGVSLLTDGDGLAILRDASIGHIISKLNQVTANDPLNQQKSVYNFWIGDGACRLNGGMELAFHLMGGYKTNSLTNLFVFNNHTWAIEDNLVADTYSHHHLYNQGYYDLLAEHGRVCICDTEHDLREILVHLSNQARQFLQGHADDHPGTEVKPGMHIIVVRGLKMDLPPVLGDLEPIRNSREMKFMRSVLGEFAKGCEHRVPIYGCSAFEYIQYLHIFKQEMPEGKKYQYICGRTDIQAAHMCGFQQPEGKCVLFINDVYGINSLGESLRMILSGFGGRQVLLMIWHPSLLKVLDNFHLHRPPMVWPNLGPTLAKFYVRKEQDALFVDYQGSDATTTKVTDALAAGKPLVCVNMLPEQDCNYLTLETRVKAVL